nr:hypothetical protein [Tanacetum cinerariifolium]
SNPRNRQIAQPGMNMGQDRQMQMVGGNGGNQLTNVENHVIQHAVQKPRSQNVVQGNGNQNPNGNGTLVAARAEGNVTGRNGIQLQAEEFDLMAAAVDLDEIEEVNANCILMANLQHIDIGGRTAKDCTQKEQTGDAYFLAYEAEKDDDDDDDDNEEEIAKLDEQEDTESGESDAEETKSVESIFTTASSPIAPLPTPTPIMTPFTIATITTSSDAPIPSTTIPST